MIRLGLVRPLGVEFVPRLAAGFLAEHPSQEIRFTFHTDVSGPLIDSLLERKFDLLFCSQPAEKLGLMAIPVLKQRLVLITPKDHPLAAKSQIALEETAPYPQIFFAKRSGIRRVIEGMFQQIGLPPHIAYETEEDEVIAGLVAQGFGIAVVPYMDLLLKLNVNILQINSPSYERDFYMVHDPRVFLPPAVNQFRQFVLNRDTMDLKDWV